VSDQYARANAASAGMLGSCARTSLPKTPVTLPWGFTIVCPLRDGLKSSCCGRSGNQANALLKPVNALLASPGNRALFRKFYVRPSMICSTDALGGLDEPRAQPGEPSTAPAAVPSASIRAGSDAHLPVQRVDPSLSLARDPAGVGAHARRGALCECGSTRDDSCSPGNQPIKH